MRNAGRDCSTRGSVTACLITRRARRGAITRRERPCQSRIIWKEGSPMQAVILGGGEGTRLRPLTSTVPKPVVPLVDRPFISFMLEWLKLHGIDDVLMS